MKINLAPLARIAENLAIGAVNRIVLQKHGLQLAPQKQFDANDSNLNAAAASLNIPPKTLHDAYIAFGNGPKVDQSDLAFIVRPAVQS